MLSGQTPSGADANHPVHPRSHRLERVEQPLAQAPRDWSFEIIPACKFLLAGQAQCVVGHRSRDMITGARTLQTSPQTVGLGSRKSSVIGRLHFPPCPSSSATHSAIHPGSRGRHMCTALLRGTWFSILSARGGGACAIPRSCRVNSNERTRLGSDAWYRK